MTALAIRLPRPLDVVSSLLASGARAAAGMTVGPLGPRPAETLTLYDFEGCPYCRRAREVLTELDLEAHVRPCPKGGKRFRPEAVRVGGRAKFPLLIDPNARRNLYEAEALVRYLSGAYGDGTLRRTQRLGLLTHQTSRLASGFRLPRGIWARASRAPAQPLELWSFEASPYCRIVREVLSELELPYLLHNVGKASPSRAAFIARSGKMQVPYLLDANTGRELFESSAIVDYLERTYAA